MASQSGSMAVMNTTQRLTGIQQLQPLHQSSKHLLRAAVGAALLGAPLPLEAVAEGLQVAAIRLALSVGDHAVALQAPVEEEVEAGKTATR